MTKQYKKLQQQAENLQQIVCMATHPVVRQSAARQFERTLDLMDAMEVRG